MAIDPDRKRCWELVETLMWIATRDESRVAALRDKSDEIKTALVCSAMRGEPIDVEHPYRASGTNGGADLERPAPQRAGRAPDPLNDLLAKAKTAASQRLPGRVKDGLLIMCFKSVEIIW